MVTLKLRRLYCFVPNFFLYNLNRQNNISKKSERVDTISGVIVINKMLDKVPHELLAPKEPLLVEMLWPSRGGKETSPVDIYFYNFSKASVIRSVYKEENICFLYTYRLTHG